MVSFNIDKFAFCDDESKLKLDDLPLLKSDVYKLLKYVKH